MLINCVVLILVIIIYPLYLLEAGRLDGGRKVRQDTR